MTFRLCAWCQELNPSDREYCRRCGHAAQVSQIECDCIRCLDPDAFEDAGIPDELFEVAV